MFLKLILSMQLLAYETIEHHALLSRDNACPKSHVLVNELSESFTRANCKGKYADAFRSNRAVLDNLNGIIVDEYATGIVYKPIVGKHAHILKCLGVPLPKSMLSLTKYGETCEVNATVDDELYDE